MKTRFRHEGLTTLELLISMSMGALILAGLTQVLVNIRQTERFQDALFRIQESGRFALDILAEDIRQAGYLGCDTASASDSHHTLSGWNATAEFSLNDPEIVSTEEGWAQSNDGSAPSLPAFSAAAGTDILLISGTHNPYVSGVQEGRVLEVVTGAQRHLHVTGMDVDAGDQLLVSSCSHRFIVRPCEVSELHAGLSLALDGCDSGENPQDLPDNLTGAQVNSMASLVYYIGYRGNDTRNTPSLFVREMDTSGFAGPALELVEGVAGLNIEYGVDSDIDSSADEYLVADQVTDWSGVLTVKLSLLTVSITDNLLIKPDMVSFSGESFSVDDRKLRRTFSTTVALRNKVL